MWCKIIIASPAGKWRDGQLVTLPVILPAFVKPPLPELSLFPLELPFSCPPSRCFRFFNGVSDIAIHSELSNLLSYNMSNLDTEPLRMVRGMPQIHVRNCRWQKLIILLVRTKSIMLLILAFIKSAHTWQNILKNITFLTIRFTKGTMSIKWRKEISRINR